MHDIADLTRPPAVATAAFTVVEVTSPPPPHVTALVRADHTPAVPDVYAFSVTLVLAGGVATGGSGGPYTYEWAQVSGPPVDFSAALPCRSPETGLPTVYTDNCVKRALAARVVTLPAGTFTSPGNYAFALTARDSAGTPGTATVAFAIVDAPFGGRLYASTAATDPTTPITATAPGWVDPTDSGDTLEYRFFYVDAAAVADASSSTAASRVYLGERSVVASLTFTLPVGVHALGVEVTASESDVAVTYLPYGAAAVVVNSTLPEALRQEVFAEPDAFAGRACARSAEARQNGQLATAMSLLAQDAGVVAAAVCASATPPNAPPGTDLPRANDEPYHAGASIFLRLLTEALALLPPLSATDSVALPADLVWPTLALARETAAAASVLLEPTSMEVALQRATSLVETCASAEAQAATAITSAATNTSALTGGTADFGNDKLDGYLAAADGLLVAASRYPQSPGRVHPLVALAGLVAKLRGMSAAAGAVPAVSQRTSVSTASVKLTPDMLTVPSALAAPVPASMAAAPVGSGVAVQFPTGIAAVLPAGWPSAGGSAVPRPLVSTLTVATPAVWPLEVLNITDVLASLRSELGDNITIIEQGIVAPVVRIAVYGGDGFSSMGDLVATQSATVTSAPSLPSPPFPSILHFLSWGTVWGERGQRGLRREQEGRRMPFRLTATATQEQAIPRQKLSHTQLTVSCGAPLDAPSQQPPDRAHDARIHIRNLRRRARRLGAGALGRHPRRLVERRMLLGLA